MKKYILFIPIIFLFSVIPLTAQDQSQVAFPEVPRVSAYEVYSKYKSGKAIIVHAGGEAFDRRHILGAVNVPEEKVLKGEIKLPNFPNTGIEIFTYCY